MIFHQNLTIFGQFLTKFCKDLSKKDLGVAVLLINVIFGWVSFEVMAKICGKFFAIFAHFRKNPTKSSILTIFGKIGDFDGGFY